MNRRDCLKTMVAAAGAVAAGTRLGRAENQPENAAKPSPAAGNGGLPCGKIGDLQVSRMLLGGNLLTHFTHSRDLRYVYRLTAKYNTEEKILATLSAAEAQGINTLCIHNSPGAMQTLHKHRRQGGKIQWIICPTAPVNDNMVAYTQQVKELVDNGCEAIYLWGVHSDPLVAQGKIGLVAKAVEVAKNLDVPSGVGGHDLNVVIECEKNKVPCDFYIKTFHHHNYPSGPKPEQLAGPTSEERPAYWCRDPQKTIEVMKDVQKPWLAFKIMAAGAIPPEDAFRYAFANGADHALVGMFDFEIAEDVALLKSILPTIQRTRPWRS
ncbi:MAG: hypothetical protein NTV49_15040 [Kiritimatiellaeota bacterium]|nr:hypothetical protein [Kiritimatiellota bacterium]